MSRSPPGWHPVLRRHNQSTAPSIILEEENTHRRHRHPLLVLSAQSRVSVPLSLSNVYATRRTVEQVQRLQCHVGSHSRLEGQLALIGAGQWMLPLLLLLPSPVNISERLKLGRSTGGWWVFVGDQAVSIGMNQRATGRSPLKDTENAMLSRDGNATVLGRCGGERLSWMSCFGGCLQLYRTLLDATCSMDGSGSEGLARV